MTAKKTQAQQTQAPKKAPSGFTLMQNCKFRLHTLDEAKTLSKFASEMFHDPERVQPGLYELLANAVEHGCLGIGHKMKGNILANGTWMAEVTRRLSLPENRKKGVDLIIAKKPEGTFAIIADPGPGFNWRDWTSIDPARAQDNHGRGIARAKNISFDGLAYNEKGNQVVAHTRDKPDIVW